MRVDKDTWLCISELKSRHPRPLHHSRLVAAQHSCGERDVRGEEKKKEKNKNRKKIGGAHVGGGNRSLPNLGLGGRNLGTYQNACPSRGPVGTIFFF